MILYPQVGPWPFSPLRRREGLRPLPPTYKYTAIYSVLWLSHFFALVDQDGSTWPNISPKTTEAGPTSSCAHIAPRWANIAPRWANIAGRPANIAPKMAPSWSKRANIAASWPTSFQDAPTTDFMILYLKWAPGRLSGVSPSKPFRGPKPLWPWHCRTAVLWCSLQLA